MGNQTQAICLFFAALCFTNLNGNLFETKISGPFQGSSNNSFHEPKRTENALSILQAKGKSINNIQQSAFFRGFAAQKCAKKTRGRGGIARAKESGGADITNGRFALLGVHRLSTSYDASKATIPEFVAKVHKMKELLATSQRETFLHSISIISLLVFLHAWLATSIKTPAISLGHLIIPGSDRSLARLWK